MESIIMHERLAHRMAHEHGSETERAILRSACEQMAYPHHRSSHQPPAMHSLREPLNPFMLLLRDICEAHIGAHAAHLEYIAIRHNVMGGMFVWPRIAYQIHWHIRSRQDDYREMCRAASRRERERCIRVQREISITRKV